MAKSEFSSDGPANLVLARLAPESFDGIGPHLHPVELEIKQLIYQPNTPIRYVYFVEHGMVSVVSIMEDGSSIEVGTIGKEGVRRRSFIGTTTKFSQPRLQLRHALCTSPAIVRMGGHHVTACCSVRRMWPQSPRSRLWSS
jgi:hypothetical protein